MKDFVGRGDFGIQQADQFVDAELSLITGARSTSAVSACPPVTGFELCVDPVERRTVLEYWVGT